jgi:hypothetical protein
MAARSWPRTKTAEPKRTNRPGWISTAFSIINLLPGDGNFSRKQPFSGASNGLLAGCIAIG